MPSCASVGSICPKSQLQSCWKGERLGFRRWGGQSDIIIQQLPNLTVMRNQDIIQPLQQQLYIVKSMTYPLPAMCPFTLNPWHGVSPGARIPEIVNAIIEIPKGSKIKYEIDKPSGLLKLDRVLFSAVHYPHNYGFIPQTYCDDHDPLDILVLCSFDVNPLTIVEARVLGVMNMIDQGEADDKIIAVATNDIGMRGISSLQNLPPHLLQEVHRFFEDYKKLEGKDVVVNQFRSKDVAMGIIEDALNLYNTTFRPKVEPLMRGLVIPSEERPIFC